MCTVSARPNPREAHEPGETEIGLTVAAADVVGDAIAADDAVRSIDDYDVLDPYMLAAARTDADADALCLAFEAALSASIGPAEVVDLTAWRRRATPTPERGELRAA